MWLPTFQPEKKSWAEVKALAATELGRKPSLGPYVKGTDDDDD
jgi:hypothetical protein